MSDSQYAPMVGLNPWEHVDPIDEPPERTQTAPDWSRYDDDDEGPLGLAAFYSQRSAS